jgi:hypothetical protein
VFGSRTAPIAGGSFVAGYAVVVATGSRALGGLVLLAGGVWCIAAWTRQHGPRLAAALAGLALAAFVVSHVLALVIGAWPAVLLVAAGTAAVVWRYADAAAIARVS